MKLLIEKIEDVSYITEEKEGQKNLYIEGVFLQAIPNRNNRIYPEKTLHREVNRYIEESVKQNRAYGELNHPSGPSINLDRVSHLIESLTIDGKNVYGRARVVTENPCGATVRGLINAGANLGVSSRGLGSLKQVQEGLMEVQGDFRLVTAADIVADPSAPDAFVKGIMEDTEYYYDITKGIWIEQKVHDMKTEMKKMTKRELEESKARLFRNYLKLINAS